MITCSLVDCIGISDDSVIFTVRVVKFCLYRMNVRVTERKKFLDKYFQSYFNCIKNLKTLDILESYVRFDVLIAVLKNIQEFWVVRSRSKFSCLTYRSSAKWRKL